MDTNDINVTICDAPQQTAEANVETETSMNGCSYGGDGAQFVPLASNQIFNKTISDVYIVGRDSEPSEVDDAVARSLDATIVQLDSTKDGFCGYLSWAYAMLTLFYITRRSDYALQLLDMVEKCIDSVERYIITGEYSNNFVNYHYGSFTKTEDWKTQNDEMVKTAKYIHARSSSFESGFSLATVMLLDALSNDDMGAAKTECDHLRSIAKQLRGFFEEERDRETIQNIVAAKKKEENEAKASADSKNTEKEVENA